jgi:hypothetical protein
MMHVAWGYEDDYAPGFVVQLFGARSITSLFSDDPAVLYHTHHASVN